MTFESYLSDVFGEDLDQFLKHPDVPSFVRANPQRTDPERLDKLLGRYGVEIHRHDAWPFAWKVNAREENPAIRPGNSLHHYLGAYTIQSLGSMVPPLMLEPQPGERILDLCASPGSKSSQIAMMLQEKGWLVANELSGSRMSPLAASLDTIGATNVALINRDGAKLPKLLTEQFDRVLADVPCSGLGRKEHLGQNKAFYDRRGGPTRLPDLQYRLLLAATKLLKPGGRLVYSTCSLSPIENEGVVSQALKKLPLKLVEPRKIDGLQMREGRTRYGHQGYDPSLVHARRLTPYENPTEGFFVAVMEKTDAVDPRFKPRLEPDADTWRETLSHTDPLVEPLLAQLTEVYGLPEGLFAQWRYLMTGRGVTMVSGETTRVWHGVMRAGASLAKRSSWAWRLSPTAIQRFGDKITRGVIHLNETQLLAMLAGESIPLPQEQVPSTTWPVLAADCVGGPFARGVWMDGLLRWKCPRRYVLPLA